MFDEFKDWSIVLASSSPRRQDFLKQLGFNFVACPADIDETIYPKERAKDYVTRVSREKGDKVYAELSSSMKNQKILVISADTIVVLDDKILLKPENDAHAYQILTSLSGKWHKVFTAISILSVNKIITRRSRTVESSVLFRDFNEQDIRKYIQQGEGKDKAGAYGLQGIGGFFVKEISGSYSNVVGLPLSELIEEMRAAIA